MPRRAKARANILPLLSDGFAFGDYPGPHGNFDTAPNFPGRRPPPNVGQRKTEIPTRTGIKR